MKRPLLLLVLWGIPVLSSAGFGKSEQQSAPKSETFGKPETPASDQIPEWPKLQTPEKSKPRSILDQFSILAGPAVLFVKGNNFVTAALVLDYELDPHWSLEAGATIPEESATGFRSINNAGGGGLSFEAHVKTLSEYSLMGYYTLPHGDQNWVVPKVGAGISMMSLENTVHVDQTGFAEARNNNFNTSVSPEISGILSIFSGHRVFLHIEAAYAFYSNSATSKGQTFDLDLSSLWLRPMVGVRL